MGSGVEQSPSAAVSSCPDPPETPGHSPFPTRLWLTPVALPTEPYSYDFPEDVAPALGASLSHLLGATNPTQKKKGEHLKRGQQGAGEAFQARLLVNSALLSLLEGKQGGLAFLVRGKVGGRNLNPSLPHSFQKMWAEKSKSSALVT